MNSKGTFLHCTNCHECINCCQSFDKLNAPLISEEEYVGLKNDFDNFADKTETSLYALKLINDRCIFYQDNKCLIYDRRPLDCRLYPFDIIKKDAKYYLILYKLKCLNDDFFKEENSIDFVIEKIKPFIDDYTNSIYYEKMKDTDYIIIREIM